MTHLHVVAGIIHSPDREELLIAKRPDHVHQGGLWEFPGGKLDDGETPRQALARELREELAITVTQAEPFTRLEYTYPDKSILLDFWRVLAFEGRPEGRENQQILWVPLVSLRDYHFPDANYQVLDLLL